MSNYVMQVNLFDSSVRCETDGNLVSLNDLIIAGNQWRGKNGLSSKTLADITGTKAFDAFKIAVCKKLGKEEGDVFKSVRGRNGRTMAHLFIAIYVAEQMSPEFHVEVISVFVEGKLLEFRELGGTEFKTLNAAIDLYLPGREGKVDNKGIYINAAKILRRKLLGPDAQAGDWDKASVAQTHSRYETEKMLSNILRVGAVRDWEHLKEIMERL